MQVKVWNDNIYPLKQYFKGNHITIPAKSFIEMEFYEAHEFLGTYHPVEYDADEMQDPKSYKMCRIEREDAIKGIQERVKKNICISCAHVSPSPEELEAHIKARHKDQATLSLPDVDTSLQAKAERDEEREALKEKLREELRAEILAEQKQPKTSKTEKSSKIKGAQSSSTISS